MRRLGRFVPSELDPAALEREWPWAWMPDCSEGRLSVRRPGHPVLVENLAWHHDDGPRVMVVWANEQPTELRLADGQVVVGEPFEVIWFDNRLVAHRQPSGTDETRRWFAAVRCA